jgi:hypothetical protein
LKLAQEVLNLITEAASKDTPLSEEPTDPNLHLPLEEHKLYYEEESLKQELLESKDTHNLRLSYTTRIFILVCTWLAFVVISVYLTGFKSLNFSLSDKVLIAFITSTTISVLGLFIVVAKWMFPINNPKNDKKE